MPDLRTDWRFHHQITSADLGSCLPADLTLEVSASLTQTLAVCDSFTGLIWQAGYLLVQIEGGELQLWHERDQPLATSTPDKGVRFWWQLPKGELAAQLKKIIDMRAFLPKFHLRLTTSLLNLRNTDEKIVTRVRLFRIAPLAGSALSLATFLPLRGYTEDYQGCMAGFAALESETVPPLTLRQLVIEAGLKMETPSSKAEFQLQPLELAEPAILRMAQLLLQTARQYEPGLVADIDTEFVHQYRVNIRKTRSLISLFRKTLSPRRYQQLKAELKTLGSRTNQLRDLDVFLLGKDIYHQMLPPHLRPGLGPVFCRISRRRAAALKQVVSALEHPDYGAQIEQISLELEGDAEFVTRQASTPLKQLVCHKGLRLYRKICRAGQAISDETPDAEIHSLRISAKKLRYLLELFGELFPKPKVKELISHLKKIQDNLGRFNDYAVQAKFLLELGHGRVAAAQSASLNGISAVLYHQQQQERDQVFARIAAFSSPQVSEKFEKLLTMESKEDTEA